jgi:hypothetical protein
MAVLLVDIVGEKVEGGPGLNLSNRMPAKPMRQSVPGAFDYVLAVLAGDENAYRRWASIFAEDGPFQMAVTLAGAAILTLRDTGTLETLGIDEPAGIDLAAKLVEKAPDSIDKTAQMQAFGFTLFVSMGDWDIVERMHRTCLGPETLLNGILVVLLGFADVAATQSGKTVEEYLAARGDLAEHESNASKNLRAQSLG